MRLSRRSHRELLAMTDWRLESEVWSPESGVRRPETKKNGTISGLLIGALKNLVIIALAKFQGGIAQLVRASDS